MYYQVVQAGDAASPSHAGIVVGLGGPDDSGWSMGPWVVPKTRTGWKVGGLDGSIGRGSRASRRVCVCSRVQGAGRQAHRVGEWAVRLIDENVNLQLAVQWWDGGGSRASPPLSFS